MKSILFFIGFFLLLLVVPISALAQKITYKTDRDILYREGTNLTDYMNKRCRLDLYYPENTSGFTTLVWFHGGGITGGEKYIPEQWKNKGIAVVAVNYRLSPTNLSLRIRWF